MTLTCGLPLFLSLAYLLPQSGTDIRNFFLPEVHAVTHQLYCVAAFTSDLPYDGRIVREDLRPLLEILKIALREGLAEP